MGKGKIWPVEMKEVKDLKTGLMLKQLTDYRGHSHHLYFTNPGWYAGGEKLLFGSDRENRNNLFSIELSTGAITQLTELEPLDPPYEVGFLKVCVNPHRNEAYYIYGLEVRALDLDSLEERVLGKFDPGFRISMINCTADGTSICGGEFEDLSSKITIDYLRGYIGFAETHDAYPQSRIIKFATDGSGQEVVWEEEYWIGHVNTSPTQPNILTFCHEGPWDKVDNRMWGLDLKTGKGWKIRERKENESVGHEYWYADGIHLGYHGRYPDKHAIFGKIKYDDSDNVETPCEKETGHTHSNDDNLIVGDGGREVRLWKKEGNVYSGPRMLAEHRSTMNIQKVHVHPRFTADGRQVLFTSDWTGYGNVYLADVPEFESLSEIP
ncbi:oligogalacturonate lyase family protein [Planctomycetota bacterium]